jgi:hypothetical protein
MPLINPIILNNFKRVIDPNEKYLLNEGADAKYDGKSELKPGTILKVGRFGQFRMQVTQDLGNEIEIKNITKNYNDAPFKRPKTDYKGAFIVESKKDIVDYAKSTNKILVGLKTNLLKDMKDRYDFMVDGDSIHFFDKNGEHFGTIFDVGSRYQELRHNGKLNDLGRLKESEINEEATTSWASMMKGVKSGGSGPWSLVATEYKKVIDQEINIKTKEILPAAFEAMRRKHPKATIHIEDAGGAVVWINKK